LRWDIRHEWLRRTRVRRLRKEGSFGAFRGDLSFNWRGSCAHLKAEADLRTQQQSEQLSLRDMNLPTVFHSLEEEVPWKGIPKDPQLSIG